MAGLSDVTGRLKKAAAKLTREERAALAEAVKATRRALAGGSPDDVKALVKRLEAIASRPAVKRALEKLAAETGADKRTLIRALEQAAQRYRG